METEIVIRSKVAIKDGQLGEFRAAWQALEARAASESGTLHYAAYIDEKTGEVVSMEQFASSRALLAHFENGADLFPKLFETCDAVALEVYGEPNDEAREAMLPFENILVLYDPVTANRP